MEHCRHAVILIDDLREHEAIARVGCLNWTIRHHIFAKVSECASVVRGPHRGGSSDHQNPE
jgi:hypothetical protein